MSVRRLWVASAFGLLCALTGVAADDPYGDPIPKGAKLRLGTARMRTGFGITPTALTPDGKAMVAISADGSTVFIDPTTGKQGRAVKPEIAYGNTSGFSNDGTRAVTATYGTVVVWDTRNGATLAKVTRSVPVGENGVSLSGDGKRVALGGVRDDSDKGPKDKSKLVTALVWDTDAKKELARVTVVQNQSANVVLSPDGRRLATWGYHTASDAKELRDPATDPSRVVQFWDVTSGQELSRVRVLTGYSPRAVAFNPDSSLAAVSSGDGEILLVEAATGATKLTLIGRARQGQRLVFSPDGRTLAGAGDDGSIQRWAVADGKRLDVTDPPVAIGYAPRELRFTDNERVVAWAGRYNAIVVWEAPGGKLLSPAGGHTASIRSAALPPGGKVILTSSDDGAVFRWDAATGKQLETTFMKSPFGGITPNYVTSPVSLSSDGTRVLAGEGFGGMGIYDMATGSQLFALPTYDRNSRCLFTPDGTKIVQVLNSFDLKKNPARVLVWDVATTRKLGEVTLPGIGYPAAAVTPDGKSLITAGIKQDDSGKTGGYLVTGWDLATGKKLGEYSEPGGFATVYAVAAGDNKSVVVTSQKGDGKLIVVDFTSGKRLREFDVERGRPVAAPVVSPDGKTVAIPLGPDFRPGSLASVVLCDIETGKVWKRLAGVSGQLSMVTFSPDGKTLITGSNDTTLLVWEIAGK